VLVQPVLRLVFTGAPEQAVIGSVFALAPERTTGLSTISAQYHITIRCSQCIIAGCWQDTAGGKPAPQSKVLILLPVLECNG
jgi:hypothetical protein